jgi:hypothetical protein
MARRVFSREFKLEAVKQDANRLIEQIQGKPPAVVMSNQTSTKLSGSNVS